MTLRLAASALIGISSLLPAADSALQVITLKDSSVIRAQVTEMSGGFYLVNSPVLGQIKIPTAEVVAIRNEGAAVQSAAGTDATSSAKAEAAQPSPGSVNLESLRSSLSSKVQNLVSTRDGMNAVMNFSNNPDVKAVINDPQVMQAIQNGDYNALMKSPAMKTLIDNPQTQSLIQSIMQPQGPKQTQVSPEKSTAPAQQ